MLLKRWLEPPRHLPTLFLAITLAPALALSWLSWRMIEQDRLLDSYRQQERRENAADVASAALLRVLAEVEEQLSSFSAGGAPRAEGLGEGAVLAVFGSQGAVGHAGAGLLYYPGLRAREPPEAVFAAGETLEFQKRDLAAAIAAYRELARLPDPLVRAGALVRLSRSCRKRGDRAAALAALDELATLGVTPVGGLPAKLAARRGRALLFEEGQRQEELQREATALHAELDSGRWQLTRASYQFLAEEAHRWLGRGQPEPGEQEALALAAAAESAWSEWRNGALAQDNQRGRRTLWAHDRSVLVFWRASPERLALAAIGPRFLESHWLRGLETLRTGQGIEFALTDAEGHGMPGRPRGASARQAVRLPLATGLPWTLHAATGSAANLAPEIPGRRNLLFAGLAMMALLTLTGSYFISRAVSREVEVARLQSDFVAAVSHEFRTPLTTLRHLAELLLRGRVSSEERRRQFYEALVRESERLHRLVEGLLNLKCMQAGALEYRFEPFDPAALLRDIVAEFEPEISKDSYRILVSEDGTLSPIRADRESLSCVFWNLLDNAVKYSPECRTVWVDLVQQGNRVAVRVRDKGVGIPAGEQKEVFRRFARGAGPKASRIQGAGLGLAMARQIVDAHGGEITLESAPGQGSTFTVLLPAAE